MKTDQETLIELANDLFAGALKLRAIGHSDVADDVEASAQAALVMAARDFPPVVITDDDIPF